MGFGQRPVPVEESILDHIDDIRRWCRRHCGDVHLAEDVAQEVALAALLKRHQIRDPDCLRPWLFRVAQRRLVDALRRREDLRPLPGEIPARSTRPPDEVSDNRQERLRRAVRRLPLSLRLPVRLYYFQGQSIRDVADSLDTTVSGVKARLHRARALLRKSKRKRRRR